MGEKYYVDIISALARQTVNRLVAVIILLIVLLFGSNLAWIIYESKWEVVETTTIEAEQETRSGNNFAVTGDFYGTSESPYIEDTEPSEENG